MLSFSKRKYHTIFARFALFAFFFAWLACTSHFSLVSPVLDSHRQSDHRDESPSHISSCLDHTYQISARDQGNYFSGDIVALVVPTPILTFDFSRLSNISEEILFNRPDQSSRRYSFLEHTVLRL